MYNEKDNRVINPNLCKYRKKLFYGTGMELQLQTKLLRNFEQL